jgi:hypothetical protein
MPGTASPLRCSARMCAGGGNQNVGFLARRYLLQERCSLTVIANSR